MAEDAAAKRARVAGGDRSRTGHTGLVDPTRDGIGGCHWGYVTPVPRSLVDRHEGRQRDGKRAAEGTAIQVGVADNIIYIQHNHLVQIRGSAGGAEWW